MLVIVTFYFKHLHLTFFYVITNKIHNRFITEMKKNKSLLSINTNIILDTVLSLFSTPQELVFIHLRTPFVTRR